MAVAAALALAAWPSAQTPARLTSPPIVTADNEPWYREGKAITFAGDFYVPSGAKRYFDPNVMVRTGSFRGIPLYADTTLEPYSVVFVPLEGALMQPYERRPFREVVGTSGWRPAGPLTPESAAIPQAAAPPMRAPSIAPLIDDLPPPPPPGAAPPPLRLDPKPPPPPAPVRPSSRNGIWIEFQGQWWKSAGPAVGFTEDRFVPVGTKEGVYVERRLSGVRRPSRIYLMTRPGVVAPFERSER
jgi:hypothetical protein